jgi:Phage integrase family
MHRVDAYQMVRRRTAEAGLKGKLGCHVFRATGITAYLEAGGTLENAQAMAAHESPRTTKLYDRTGDEITLDEVERIQIQYGNPAVRSNGATLRGLSDLAVDAPHDRGPSVDNRQHRIRFLRRKRRHNARHS